MSPRSSRSTVCIVALAYTYSRGAIVALIVAGLLAAFLRHVRPVILLVGIGLVVALAAFVLPPEVTHRVSALGQLVSPSSGTDPSLRGRTSENLAALEMWRTYPIAGVGPGNFELRYLDYSARIGIDDRAENRNAHSLYLESLAETGLIGSVPFFALIFVALRRPWHARRRLPREAALDCRGCVRCAGGVPRERRNASQRVPSLHVVVVRARPRGRSTGLAGAGMIAALVFWGSVGTIAWIYAGYPLVLAGLGRLRPRPRERAPVHVPISVIVAAHNEDAIIAAKIDNIRGSMYPSQLVEIIVASDGSDDRTVERARRAGADVVLDLPRGRQVARAQRCG